MILTAGKASMRSLRNQTVRGKTWVRTIESHPIQRSPSMNCLAEFADGAFRNTPLQPDQQRHASDRSSSWRDRIPRTAPLFDPSQHPPRHQPEVEEKMILRVPKTNNKDQARSRRCSHRPKSDPKRPVAAAARHGNYASAPPRKSSYPRLSDAPTAALPLHVAYRTRPSTRDHCFTSSPLHASSALYRLAR
jgi:hypothetical protein